MATFKSSDGLDISYRVIGDGDPVVLLHGWMVGGAVWDRVTDALTGAGLKLYIPDQRGAGESAKPERGYDIEQYVADAIALADAAGLERFALVGHSMGGQIAQVVAAELGDRVSRMVLLCPVPAAGMPLPDEAAALFRNSGGNTEAQTTILNMACKQLDEDALAFCLATAATVSTPCVEQAFDAWTGENFADRLGRVTAKTTVYGTDDPFLTPEILNAAVVELIANADFHHQPGPGHYPQVETPADTGAKLAELLKN
ncbi:hydrolase, alpha/beta fold family protein [Plesiocystis pacifica SIR-1]|uniref:Hydrolase, alpha/beta fold family protein n=1 Tax=Plesiocystis pacifica SIR-1 TaxID=391625 RepID=A6GJD3_9BACT|nr:alpha/beta hydrolase [Plesiocystis pacifica]EDM74023.1 hydrolase, alpha/beta fold family protein [Plesiocystis pacifica SIR-1]